MRKVILGIKDVKAGAFPFDNMMFSNLAVGVRSFTDTVNKPDLVFCQHPADYQLFKLGEFDAVSGVIEPLASPEYVCTAIDLMSPVPAPVDPSQLSLLKGERA